ncbi:unnamed protein product [Leptosia nina]|uniref:Uncharacterized protein n=1 Tax=Leptosia nina TaxID=320188 RepID=A0AAV1JL48_9NEOP
MNQEKLHMKHLNRFVCSMCSNKKTEIDRAERLGKLCPICFTKFPDTHTKKNLKTKLVQTAETDTAQGITLLNEVLHVFQSKKVDSNSKRMLKDASVNTDGKHLVMSEIFQYSIEDDSHTKSEGKFTLINCEPSPTKRMEPRVILSKHKSSSIPQMKLEELKHSLKEKTKSKDAIEEVNRMFANVRKFNFDSETNRPLIRNGPRILPVVKTATFAEDSCAKYKYQCDQDYQMSSGDSGLQGCKKEQCAECLYMCCHYQRYKCENCQVKSDESKYGRPV